MFRIRAIASTLTLGLFAGAALLTGASSASAADVTSIEIHHRLCPTDQAITDYFTDCHDHLANQSFDFVVTSEAGTDTVSTDAGNGNATASAAPGTVEISGGVPGEFAKTFVYCSQDGVGIDVSTTDIGVSFDAPAGDVVCDWYNTPEDLSGNGGNNNGGVTTLPNTGAGAPSSNSDNLFFALLTGIGTVGAAAVVARARNA